VSEALGRFLFQQLVLALDFCHRRGKVCRGVKLANTLLALAPGQLPLVKLADFGFSKDVGQHGAPQSQVRSVKLPASWYMLSCVCSVRHLTSRSPIVHHSLHCLNLLFETLVRILQVVTALFEHLRSCTTGAGKDFQALMFTTI
jgi:serine/threonine protein kinase